MSSIPRYAKVTPDVTRGLTSDLWQQSLERYASNDPAYGTRFCDDFVDNLVGLTGTTSATVDTKWTAADSAEAGGTYSFANAANPDGHGVLASGGTTAHYGVDARGAAYVNLPTHSTDARGRVVVEARVDLDSADTVFVGLSEAGLNFLSSTSALPTNVNYIGFYTDDNGATMSFVCLEDDGAVSDSFTIPAADLQASGMQKLGFAVNKDRSVDVCVNGNWYSPGRTGISPLALPIQTLIPRLVATAGGGTTAPSITVDEIDVFVESITT